MFVLLLCDDLVFPSRLQGVAGLLGLQLRTATDAETLLRHAVECRPRLVVVDLSARGLDIHALIAALRKLEHPPRKIVAFGPHVQTGRLHAAAEAGADAVRSRGQFIAEMKRWLADAVDNQPDTPENGPQND